MAKVDFSIVTNSNALWVRVLRLMYGVQSRLPESLSRGCCSFLWRSFTKVWPLIRENLPWSVGDEKYFFRLWVTEEIINKIVGIPRPHSSSGPDRIILGGTSTGSFSLKSAYERAIRGVGIDSACEVCGHGSEDVLHVLRDFPAARDIWNKLIPTDKLSRFYSGPIYEASPQILMKSSRHRTLGYLRWFETYSGMGLRKCSNSTDSFKAVNAIQDESFRGSNFSLVKRIHQLLKIVRHWEIQHIFRDENKIGDGLVKMICDRRLGLRLFEDSLLEEKV
ncbi:hypothetical protein CXB51_017021 [Gossypium anomalum]|uniref:Reverse transcriptase n=1 Tax=Gossypium anomalum TaxID=47600 RepID=A0A8J5Z0X2_9ROSI|nr:hypothetical protein CXB51_017021 [Gossypium anomalum]